MTGPCRALVSLLLVGSLAGCASSAEVAKSRVVTVPDGTELTVRLDSAVGSDTSQVNDPVTATLTEAVRVDGAEILPVAAFSSAP